ncbi:MAG: hypothetical protein HN725_10775 [Alphaproteobacteria bacterium]|jgi:hypothetical protein|nr:hypothetical protein [Alphaproteobacteria bacterium]MBT4082226.1 hypothetical protein [Alphaproteobacteria bacterium]MBT4544983.1 hypothetical protein [Alphaproteobacteria bacterium]MBT7745766.1 hypothetical protein [Alphaproteobacteria bacterium]
MNLIQFVDEYRTRQVGEVISPDEVRVLKGVANVRDLALDAISQDISLATLVAATSGTTTSYVALVNNARLLPPLDHPDPAHCLVTGTGLTHLGSAATRDSMHQEEDGPAEPDDTSQTDSMRMFQMGLENGKPAAGDTGVQPEWFYKGNGTMVVGPEADLPSPAFALDGGEEPEIAGLYVIAPDGTPCRVGYALGNEFSDHITERQNYLYLAHSKLRHCSYGPELMIGALPEDLQGTSRIRRDNSVLWEKPFLSGEANMSHTIANLEHHHFKYDLFCQPGDVHVHFFGTATLSFADEIVPQDGDVFEIEVPEFGRPLRNRLSTSTDEATLQTVRML